MQLVALMIGAYIFTQMVETLFKKQEMEFGTLGRTILILSASFTILLTLIICLICILPTLK